MSGFVVHPVVATARVRDPMVCDPTEVEHGFWVDVDRLRRAPVRERPYSRGDRDFMMRGWDLPEGFLWGATAMMLAELFALLDED